MYSTEHLGSFEKHGFEKIPNAIKRANLVCQIIVLQYKRVLSFSKYAGFICCFYLQAQFAFS